MIPNSLPENSQTAGLVTGFGVNRCAFFACELLHGTGLYADWLALKSFTVVRLYNSA